MDEIIEKVGEFGRFQYKIIVIVGLLSALSSACIYATIFIAAEPDFFCQTRNSTSGEFTKLSFDDSCQLWIQMQHNDTDPTNTTICEFDRTFYGRTIINDWHLICDSHYKASLTQTIHILGSIFAIFSGVIGDKFGRRTSVMWFSLALTFSLLFTQFLLSFDNTWFTVDVKYLIYSVAQFLIGFLVNCLYCTAYVLLMEFTTEHFRTKIANLNSYIYVLGELIVLVVYYFSRDWHVLNWFVGSFSLVLLVVIYFYLPESPAWYISQNKLKRAQKVLKQIARTNGRKKEANEITYELVRSIHSQEKSLMNDENDDTIDFLSIKHQPNSASSFQPNCVQSNGCAGGGEKLMNGDSDEKNGNGIGNSSHIKTNSEEEMSAMSILHDLFRPRKNCFKTSLLAYIWAALMLLYYGISLGVTSVELVNPYLMYFLSSIAEFIGYIFCYLNDILGRKKTLILFFLTTTLIYGSIALLSNGTADEDETFFSPKAISLMILALVGKCAVSGAYNISYIYTSELHPTYTRNTALLFLNCVGSVSSLIAPQINLLKNLLARPAPYIVYSICALFGCVCVWILPETKVD